jgi:hypothetical protein
MLFGQMDKKKRVFLSKTRTFLSDPKLLNGSVHVVHGVHGETRCCFFMGPNSFKSFSFKPFQSLKHRDQPVNGGS